MSNEERRAVVLTTTVLLLASLLRFCWEARPIPPILPQAEVPEELLRETRLAVERQERMNTPLAPGELVDPNRGPDVELARLPGIGPALAARIVANREGEGAFRRPSDLLRVSGIGPATLERVRPHLDLADPPLIAGTANSASGLGRSPSGGRVDLNRATAAELETLPGVGPVLSGRIIEYRRRVGALGSVEELGEVSGIGPATIERLRPLVRVRP